MKALRRSAVGALVALLAVTSVAGLAGASHFRYGHYGWTPGAGNEVSFTVHNAFARNYSCVSPSGAAVACGTSPDGTFGPVVGDYFRETTGGTFFDFGDGTRNPPSGGAMLYKVTSVEYGVLGN